MGDAAKRYLTGLTEGSGSFSCNWDPDDGEQMAIDVGDELALTLYPEGATGSVDTLTTTGNGAGETVTVTGISYSADVGGLVTMSVDFRGFLVRDTVTIP